MLVYLENFLLGQEEPCPAEEIVPLVEARLIVKALRQGLDPPVDEQPRSEGASIATCPVRLLAENRYGGNEVLNLCNEGAVAVPQTQLLPVAFGLTQIADEETVERAL